jgi:hypothetical protein
MTTPTNGTTYNLTHPPTTTTQAVKKVDAQQVVSVPPSQKAFLGLGTSLNQSNASGIKAKAAVFDPTFGLGPSVIQVPQSVAAGGATTTPSGANTGGGVAVFGADYFTSKIGSTVVKSTTFNPKAAIAVGAPFGGVIGVVLGKFFDRNAPASVTEKLANSSTNVFNPPANLSDYTFNLSPHAWSLPIAPSIVDTKEFGRYIDAPGNSQDKGSSYTKRNVVGRNPNTSPTAPKRRGTITWHATASDQKFTGNNSKPTADARQMGFQFLWNPDSFGTSVSLNPDVTPSMQDRFVGVAGAFPGQETIMLNLEINRINDFACFAHKGPKQWDPITGKDKQKEWKENFSKFYTPHKSGIVTPELMDKQLLDLYENGTLHDIEFLYQTINGPNASYMSGGWKNSLGRVTSDIGFLSATLVRIEIGPLTYLGYINGISVNHIQFTQDMKPIRSQVQITANLMASVGLAEGA